MSEPSFWIPLIAMALLLGFWLGLEVGTRIIKKKAIENGFAYYHPKTGTFTWGSLMTERSEP